MENAEITHEQTATGAPVAPPREEFLEGSLSIPRIIEHFETTIPGTGERILRLMEEQATHRRQMELKALEAQIAIPRRGQFFAFVLTVAALAAASFCAYIGQPLPASVIGGGTLVCLATVFLGTRRERNIPGTPKS